MPKFAKGSPEAKAFMAHLRSMRNQKRKGGKTKTVKGGFAFPTFLIGPALNLGIMGIQKLYNYIKNKKKDKDVEKTLAGSGFFDIFNKNIKKQRKEFRKPLKLKGLPFTEKVKRTFEDIHNQNPLLNFAKVAANTLRDVAKEKREKRLEYDKYKKFYEEHHLDDSMSD